jgi:hypothetical protein
VTAHFAADVVQYVIAPAIGSAYGPHQEPAGPEPSSASVRKHGDRSFSAVLVGEDGRVLAEGPNTHKS